MTRERSGPAGDQRRGDRPGALERLANPRNAGRARILSPLMNSSRRWRNPVRPSRRTGWQPVHLVHGWIGLMPLYLKSHSHGEYVFDHAWAEALERAGGDYYPKLQCAVPFTPVTGPRLLAATDKAREILLKTAAAAVKQIGASSLHITFLTQAEWQAAGEAGYLLRTDQQFHWENRGYASFDEFPGRIVFGQAQEFAQGTRPACARRASNSTG